MLVINDVRVFTETEILESTAHFIWETMGPADNWHPIVVTLHIALGRDREYIEGALRSMVNEKTLQWEKDHKGG